MIKPCQKCEREKAFLLIRDRNPFGRSDMKLCFDCALLEIQLRKAELQQDSAPSESR